MLVVFSIIAVFICLFCTLISVRDKLSPQFLFCGFIGLITFFASLPGFPAANVMTYILIITGILAYTIGCNIGNQISRPITVSMQLRPNFILYLVVVLLAWSLYRAFTVTVPLLMMGYPLDIVRMVYFGAEFQGFSYRPIDGMVETYVNQPFLYALIPIVSLEILKKKEERQLPIHTLFFLISWIVLSCAISGGRMLIFCLIVVVGVAYLFRQNRNKILTKKKEKKKLIVISSLSAVLIYIIYLFSIYRGSTEGGDYDFAHSIYVYFCGCIPHTALRLETETIDYTYGMTLLQGVLRPLALLYKYTLGGGDFPTLYQRAIDIAFVLQDEVQIGKFTFNAFVIPFYFFYFDGGIVAVIIDSVLYGMFCGISYKKARSTQTDITLAKYLVVVIYISTSMVRFSPYIAYYALAYFYVSFCYKRQKICKELV